MPGLLRGDMPSRVRLGAVVFDVDGTLVDSDRHGHRVAFNEAFVAAGRSDHWSEAQYGKLLRIAGGRQRLASYLVGTGLSAAEADCRSPSRCTASRLSGSATGRRRVRFR